MLARINNGWGLINSPFERDTFGELFNLLDESKPNSYHRTTPLRTVNDKEKEIEIKLFLPGFKTEEFDVEAVSDFLTVKAERKAEQLDENANYLRRERNNYSYEETFSLPTKVNNSKVTAKYSDGILTVILPKQESETPRLITVK